MASCFETVVSMGRTDGWTDVLGAAVNVAPSEGCIKLSNSLSVVTLLCVQQGV